MRISIVGTGYVGLVSGVCLAEVGHQVVCVDIDAAKVARIARGESPIVEKDLDALLARNLKDRFRVTTDLKSAIQQSEITIIAVGTPFRGDAIDLTFVRDVAAAIGHELATLDRYHLVVVKSTVVPGTTDDVVLPILEATSGKRAGAGFGVGMNPEFLREGEAIEDFMNPDRIVVGGMDERSQDTLASVYAGFDVPLVRTSNRTAEMIKYASNSFLALAISFSNEIANLSAAVGVDAMDVMHGLHLDKRLSPLLADGTRVSPGLLTYLIPGCGFGGSCFPKDVKALIAYGKDRGLPMSLLSAAMDVNAGQPGEMMRRLRKHRPFLQGTTVGVLGVAFKPGTDDIRESPALPIIAELRRDGAQVRIYDPVASARLIEETGWDDVTVADSLADMVGSSEVLMIVTRWPDFAALPALVDARHVVIDGRRMLDPATMACTYEGIGLAGGTGTPATTHLGT